MPVRAQPSAESAGVDWFPCPSACRSLDQFELLDELYKGKISLLHKAVHKASGHYVAIKQYKKKLLSPLNR